MRAHRLALAELRRLTSGKLLRLALVALLIIPSLYSGLYLYANKDPYANLKHVPAAIVVEDRGTTLATGERLEVGDKVADRLVDGNTFDWHVMSRAEATKGVDDEEYDFALIIPPDFSTNLASGATTKPKRATLEQYTNDTNGYLARTISNNVVDEVTRSVAEEVSSSAASQMLGGYAKIHTNLVKAADGADKLAAGNGKLASGAGELVTGATSLHSGTKKLRDGAVRLGHGAEKAHDGSTKLATGASRLDAGLSTLDSSTAALPGQTKRLASGARQVADGNAKLATGAAQLSTGANQAAGGARRLQRGAQDLHSGAVKVAAGAHQVADGNAKVATAGQLAAQGAGQIDSVRRQQRARLQGRLNDLQRQADSLDRAIARIQAADPNANVGALRKISTRLHVQLTMAENDLAQIDSTLNTASGKVRTASRQLNTLATGSRKVATGADQLASGSAALATGADQLATGNAGLATGANKLSDGASKAATGANQVAAGADQLADGSKTLHEGIHSAHKGSTQLAKGALTLDSGLAQLSSGADTLAANEQSAVKGANQLKYGAKQLRNGAQDARTGAKDLHKGLVKGADDIPSFTADQRRAAAQTLGNPVGVESSNHAQAANYGAGLAPFFVSLSLWIGAYVLFLVVKTLSTRALAAQQPAWRVALSGWMTPALLAVGQSFLVFWFVLKGLDYSVEHPVPAILFMAFVSMTYAAILHALASRLGAVGKFLGLVLLVVQLVSAGGTFPWQTLPGPLRVLHHWFPMSYAIDGLRHLMYGGKMVFVWKDVAVLAVFLGLALIGSTYAAARTRIWTPSRIKPDLVL